MRPDTLDPRAALLRLLLSLAALGCGAAAVTVVAFLARQILG